MASFLVVTFCKKILLFLPFPGLSNDFFRHPANTKALHYLEQLLLQPVRWNTAKGSSIPVRDPKVVGRLWGAPHFTIDWLGAVDAGAQAGVSFNDSKEERYLNCRKKPLSLWPIQRKILLLVLTGSSLGGTPDMQMAASLNSRTVEFIDCHRARISLSEESIVIILVQLLA